MNIFQPILDIFFRTYGSKTLICALQKVVKDGLADCQWELSRVLYHTIFVPYLEEYRSRVGRLVKRMFKQAVITMFLLLSAKLVLSVMQTRDVSIVQKRNLQTASRQPMFPVLRTVSILKLCKQTPQTHGAYMSMSSVYHCNFRPHALCICYPFGHYVIGQ